MGFALPSGVVNTDSAYFYADATFKLGPLIKEPSEQTLVVIDYSQLPAPFALKGSSYTLDVATNPSLVVSYPNITTIGNVLTFLLSGGIVGQQYNLSVAVQYLAANGLTVSRTDVLTVNMPSSGDCACEIINPVPSIQTQVPLGSEGWVNTAVRYFWGVMPPANPGVLDQWYNPNTQALYEWVTDGVTFFWDILAAPDFVLEAPIDGTIYSRYNGFWIPDVIQTDAPADGQNYVRFMNRWQIIEPSLPDAPLDNSTYGRKNGAWQATAIQQDAPDDGNAYARGNNGWLFAPVSPITSDAPNDGRLYNRQGSSRAGTWIADPIQEDGPQDSNLYGRLSGAWVQAYPVTNPSNYQNQAQVTAAVATGVAPMMPRAGGTFTGGVQFNVGAIFPTTAQLVVGGGSAGQVLSTNGANTLSWVDQSGGISDAPQDGTTYARNNATWVHISGGSGIPDAPSDGQLYGRQSAAWAVVPTSSGGIPDAPSDGTGYIRKALSWQRPTHTDITDWTATLAPYALTANVPASSASLPIMDGTAAAGLATTFSRGDHVHPSDTSRYAASNPAGYIPDAPSNGNQYARQNAGWAAITTGPPVTISATAPSSPQVGALWWDSVGGQLYVWYSDANSSQWVIAVNVLGNIPIASITTPLMDGTAAVGVGTTWARADHVHPSDTSIASNAFPNMDGTAAPGTAVGWSRADHVHPTDTSRYAASNPAGYQTAANVAAGYLPLAGGTLSGQLNVNAQVVSNNNVYGLSWIGSGAVYPNYNANTLGRFSSDSGSSIMYFNNSNYVQIQPTQIVFASQGATAAFNGTTFAAPNITANSNLTVGAACLVNGTVYPTAATLGNAFAINGSAAQRTIQWQSSWYLGWRSSDGLWWAQSPSGSVFQLNGSGGLYILGALTQNSDVNSKENIETFDDDPIEIIKNIKPKRFNRLTTPDLRELGFVAQDIQPHLPEAVREHHSHLGEDDEKHVKTMLGVTETSLVAVLWKAVHVLAERVEQLEAAR